MDSELKLPKLPLIPSHEIIGTVVKTGSVPSSNYSREVDLSAVGQTVLAPYAANDSLNMYLEKTSAAVALVTGCAAVIKSLSPKMSPEEIIALLQNTATNIDKANPDHLGKLGCGVPYMSRVVDYLSEKK
jgi:hypothetical protein